MIVVYKFIIECPVRGWDGAARFFENYNNTMNTDNCSLEEVFKDYEIEFYEQSANQTCEASAAIINSNSIYAVPTMLFAFQCHASCLPVYTELKVKTRQNMMKIAFTAIGAVFVIYGTVSYFAYTTWYNITMDEVLIMYTSLNASDLMVLTARGCLITCVIFSTPLLHFPCRKAQVKTFFPQRDFSWVIHLGLMVLNLVITHLV